MDSKRWQDLGEAVIMSAAKHTYGRDEIRQLVRFGRSNLRAPDLPF